MTSQDELRRRIMRRVWGIYIVRQLTAPAIRLGVFLAALVILTGSVSVPSVFENAFHVTTLEGLFTFTLSAFVSTSTMVQISVIAASVVLLSSVVDLAKRVTHRSQYA